MTKDEALKLALEALEGVLDDAPKVLDASIAGGLYEVIQCRDAITAIKEALAQPEPPPECKTEAEKIAYAFGWFKSMEAQRTWVGLTEQEQGAIMEDLNAYGTNLYQFARAIEAKLKEKNNG